MTTINDKVYLRKNSFKIDNIKKIIVLLFSIIVFISVSNSILAILHYNSIKDTEIKNNLYYFWIMAIINILCTVLCFIIFIIFLYMYDHKNILNIYKNIIISFGIITLLISLYINISLFAYYCENKKYLNIDFIFPIITYIVYIPLWIIMLSIFISFTTRRSTKTSETAEIVETAETVETAEISELASILSDFSKIIIGSNSETVTMGPSGMTITKRPYVSNPETVTMNMGQYRPNSETVKMNIGPLGMTIKTK